MNKMMCVFCCVVAIIGFVVETGCEKANHTSSLTLDPSYSDLSATDAATTQTFTISSNSLQTLSIPLSWSVSDSSLGSISSSGGTSAAYTRVNGRHGDNSIFVEDQYGAQGVATVHQ